MMPVGGAFDSSSALPGRRASDSSEHPGQKFVARSTPLPATKPRCAPRASAFEIAASSGPAAPFCA
jgi:hypothetical protein